MVSEFFAAILTHSFRIQPPTPNSGIFQGNLTLSVDTTGRGKIAFRSSDLFSAPPFSPLGFRMIQALIHQNLPVPR